MFTYKLSVCLDCVCCVSVLRFPFFFFFFFFFHAFSPHLRLLFLYGTWTVAATFDQFSVNSTYVHCSRTHIFHFFINFFIKNGSHGTIYTFKNYFATVISAISFQFQQNKFYPNRLIIVSQFIWEKNTPRASYLYFQCIHTKTHKVSPI